MCQVPVHLSHNVIWRAHDTVVVCYVLFHSLNKHVQSTYCVPCPVLFVKEGKNTGGGEQAKVHTVYGIVYA